MMTMKEAQRRRGRLGHAMSVGISYADYDLQCPYCHTKLVVEWDDITDDMDRNWVSCPECGEEFVMSYHVAYTGFEARTSV